jgi:hypothetical protein
MDIPYDMATVGRKRPLRLRNEYASLGMHSTLVKSRGGSFQALAVG